MPTFDEYAEAKVKLRKFEKKFSEFQTKRKLSAHIFKERNRLFNREGEIYHEFDAAFKNCGSHEKYMDGNREMQNIVKSLRNKRSELLRKQPFSWGHDVMKEFDIYTKIEDEYQDKIDDFRIIIETYEEELAEEERRKNSELEDLMEEIEELRKRAQGI